MKKQTKQVKFKDLDGVIRGGILVNNDFVICGCCGGIMEKEDFEILTIYEDWIPFDEYVSFLSDGE